MGNPVPFSDLFNYPEAQKAMEELLAVTREYGEVSKKALKTFSEALKLSYSDVNSLADAVEKVPVEGFEKKFKTLNETVEAHGSKIVGVKAIYKTLDDTLNISLNSVAAMGDRLKSIEKQYQTLNPLAAEDQVIMRDLAEEYQKTTVKIKELTKELKGTSASVKAAESSYTGMSGRLRQLKKELQDMDGVFDETTMTFKEGNPEVKKYLDEINKLDVALKKADASMGNYQRNVGNYESGTASLRQELRAIKLEMGEMMMRGEGTGEKFDMLKNRAGELDDTLKDVSKTISNVGSDTRNIEGVASVFEGVAGAMGIAEGALNLFDIKNKEFEETLKRLMSVQLILNGFQSIANVLQKESAAMILMSNARQKVSILLKQLETSAESKNVAVKWLSVAASRALNAAMAMSPAAWLLIAIGALAGVVLLLAHNSDSATESQKKLNDQMALNIGLLKQIQDRLQKRIESLKEENGLVERYLQSQIDLKKANLASDAELFRLQKELDDKRIENAKKAADETEKQTARVLAGYDLLAGRSSTKTGFFPKIVNRSGDSNIDKLNQAKGNISNTIRTQESAIFLLKSSNGNKEKIEQEEKVLENLNNQYDILDSQIKSQANAYKDLGLAYKTEIIDTITNKRKLQENYLKSRINDIQSELSATIEGSELEYKNKLELIERKRKLDIFNANRNQNEIKVINATAQSDTDKLYTQHRQELEQSELNSSISLLQARLNASEIGSKEEYKIRKDFIKANANTERLAVWNSVMLESERQAKLTEIRSKELLAKKDLEREKLRAEYDSKNKSIAAENELVKIKAQMVMAGSVFPSKNTRAAQSVLSPQRDLEEIERQQSELNSNMFASYAEYEQAKTDLTIQHEQKRLQIVQEKAAVEKQIRQGILDIMVTGITGVGEVWKSESDARISQADMEKTNRLILAGEDKDAQFRIEQDYQKRVNKEKAKQAKIDRALALFNIGIQTSQAVMRIWAEVPKVDFGIMTGILTGLAITQGALQAGLIMAKPIPQFKTGTRNAPEGFARVNDQAGSMYQEMILSKRGAFIPKQRNQTVWLNKGDSVMTAAETKGILSKSDVEINNIINNSRLNSRLSNNLSEGRKLEIEHTMAGAVSSLKLNEKVIGEEVGAQLSKIPMTINSFDERGYSRSVRRGNTIVNDLNYRESL